MKRMSRGSVKRLARLILLSALLCSLISTTACSRQYVVVDGDETVTVKKSELARLHQDNELLLSALKECKGQ